MILYNYVYVKYVYFQLILNEKGGLFYRHKTTLLHQGEGLIREIKWKGDFIAWTNDHVRNPMASIYKSS